MSISLRGRIRQVLLLGCASGAALLVFAVGQAAAATYPAGGSTFSGSAEGWTLSAKCNPLVPLICTASGTYDGGAGNPAGSLSDKTEIAVGLAGLIKSEAVETSPTFTVAEGGSATLSLQRAYEVTEPISLTSQVEYTVDLVDKTTGTKQKAFGETIEGASAFAAKQVPVSLVAGHSYAIEVEAASKSTLAGVGLSGSTNFRIDNVALTAPGGPGSGGGGNGGNGGEGGGGGNHGSGGVSSARLERLIKSSLIGPAVLKGNRLFVKARCPAKIGRTCKLSVQGKLNRHKPATTSRKAKVKKGKTKKFVLKVKPAARKKVRSKKKLLFKETVKAGKTKATVYKKLKLIRK